MWILQMWICRFDPIFSQDIKHIKKLLRHQSFFLNMQWQANTRQNGHQSHIFLSTPRNATFTDNSPLWHFLTWNCMNSNVNCLFIYLKLFFLKYHIRVLILWYIDYFISRKRHFVHMPDIHKIQLLFNRY